MKKCCSRLNPLDSTLWDSALLRFFTIAATFPIIQVFDTYKKGRKGKKIKIRGFDRNLENPLRKLTLHSILCFFVLLNLPVYSQQFDAAFGFGTVTAPAGKADSTGTFFPSNTGGLYPSFSADVLVKHHLGIQGEVAWRATQNL
jgi:hypothetical protein